MLVSCTGLSSASPTAFTFLKSAWPAVIIPSLGMNSELYMMLQAGQRMPPFECPELFLKEITSPVVIMSESQHMPHPCRKCCVRAGFTYRSAITYLQGLFYFGYNDTLWVLKDWYVM